MFESEAQSKNKSKVDQLMYKLRYNLDWMLHLDGAIFSVCVFMTIVHLSFDWLI